jgi:uncharacterized protein
VTPAAARDPRIDALRGFALWGILLVNIQSYLSGAPNAIGFLPPDADAADRAAYFVTAGFVVGKFMPLFGMLFGAGLAILYDKLKAVYVDPRALVRRRLALLFGFGILHGLMLYFGDITNAYAVAGLLLLRYADRGAPALARATVGWWIFAAAWLLLAIAPLSGDPADSAEALIETVQSNTEASAVLGYIAQWPVRVEMFFWQIQANLFGLPTIVALMLTGMLAQRSGWLRQPSAPAWRYAERLGLLIGLPAALAYGAWSLENAGIEQNLAMPAVLYVVHFISVTLSFLYAAAIVQRAPPWMLRWLAPAGRMPLSNYLLQSVAMGALLSGWGFGLGLSLGYAALSVLATAVFVGQTLLSRYWLATHAQGPLEALWRAATYRNAVRLTEAADRRG